MSDTHRWSHYRGKGEHLITFYAKGLPNPDSVLTMQQLEDHSYTASVDGAVPVRYTVVDTVSRFHGDGRCSDSLQCWLDQICLLLLKQDIPLEHRICIPLLYLSRAARCWYKRLYADPKNVRINSWDEFQDAIKAKFLHVRARRRCRRRQCLRCLAPTTKSERQQADILAPKQVACPSALPGQLSQTCDTHDTLSNPQHGTIASLPISKPSAGSFVHKTRPTRILASSMESAETRLVVAVEPHRSSDQHRLCGNTDSE